MSNPISCCCCSPCELASQAIQLIRTCCSNCANVSCSCGGSQTVTETVNPDGSRSYQRVQSDGFQFRYRNGYANNTNDDDVNPLSGGIEVTQPPMEVTTGDPVLGASTTRRLSTPYLKISTSPEQGITHLPGDVQEAITADNISGNMTEAILQTAQVIDIVKDVLNDPKTQAGCMALHDSCNEACSGNCCCPGCGCMDGQVGCGIFGKAFCNVIEACFGSNQQENQQETSLAFHLNELSDQYGSIAMTMALNSVQISTEDIDIIPLTQTLKEKLDEACETSLQALSQQTLKLSQRAFHDALNPTKDLLLLPSGHRIIKWLDTNFQFHNIPSAEDFNMKINNTKLFLEISESSLNKLLTSALVSDTLSTPESIYERKEMQMVNFKELAAALSDIQVCSLDDTTPYRLGGALAKSCVYTLCELIQASSTNILDDLNGSVLTKEGMLFILVDIILCTHGFIPLNAKLEDTQNIGKDVLAIIEEIHNRPVSTQPSLSPEALRHSIGCSPTSHRRTAFRSPSMSSLNSEASFLSALDNVNDLENGMRTPFRATSPTVTSYSISSPPTPHSLASSPTPLPTILPSNYLDRPQSDLSKVVLTTATLRRVQQTMLSKTRKVSRAATTAQPGSFRPSINKT